jgi:hypothetical protein
MNDEKIELRGRLWLWDLAVTQTQQLLFLAERSKSGAEQQHIRDELDAYNKSLRDFVRGKPDHEEGVLRLSVVKEYDAQNRRAFPTWVECMAIHGACIELALIYFSQVLNVGHADIGSAAKRDKPFRDQHLKAIASTVFSEKSDMDRFFNLFEQILAARDQMIGRADGKAFGIQHGNTVSTMKTYRQAWEHIDLEYWSSFLERLRIGILEYEKTQ